MFPVETAQVLIVDDEDINARLLERFLSRLYKTDIAFNGVSALQLFRKNTYDLILLDIMMPDISGLDVLRAIRETHSAQDLPIILISALSDTTDIVEGLRLHANDYITKPIDIEVIQMRAQTQIYLKQLNDERKQMVGRLQQISIMNRHLMRIASHDLKNPLNNIMMTHTLLRQHFIDQPEAIKLLDLAKLNTDSMQAIIKEFLELHVLNTNDIEPIELKPVALNHVLFEVMMTFEQATKKKVLSLDVGETNFTVQADESRLKQVVANLLSNAIKYSPPHSIVWVNAQRDNSDVVLHIIDQGSGIPADEVANLFEPFSEISTQPTGGEPSSGIGLWIVKQLMTAQNGEVGMDSPAIGGCDFWIRIAAPP